jgi:hypothetical protein
MDSTEECKPELFVSRPVSDETCFVSQYEYEENEGSERVLVVFQ